MRLVTASDPAIGAGLTDVPKDSPARGMLSSRTPLSPRNLTLVQSARMASPPMGGEDLRVHGQHTRMRETRLG